MQSQQYRRWKRIYTEFYWQQTVRTVLLSKCEENTLWRLVIIAIICCSIQMKLVFDELFTYLRQEDPMTICHFLPLINREKNYRIYQRTSYTIDSVSLLYYISGAFEYRHGNIIIYSITGREYDLNSTKQNCFEKIQITLERIYSCQRRKKGRR